MAHGVAVSDRTGNTIANNTNQAVVFDTVLDDTDGYYNVGTPDTVMVPVGLGGVYQISSYVEFLGSATGIRGASVAVNGNDVTNMINSNPGAANRCGLPSSAAIRLTAGDTVQVLAYQNSGGALDLSGDEDTQPMLTLYRIGT